MLTTRQVSTGSANSTQLPVGRVIRRAYASSAHEVAVAHNHPLKSSAAPSPTDIASTQYLRKMLWIAGIGLRDHLIVSHNAVYSMADFGPWEVPQEDFDSTFTSCMRTTR